jgi:formyl-CoA transferase
VLIAGNGDSIFKRLMQIVGRADLADDPTLESNSGRVDRVTEIDAAISEWTRGQLLADALKLLDQGRVPSSPIYTAKDIAEDPHYKARGMIQRIKTRAGCEIDIPGIVPKLTGTPGTHRFAAPDLGADTKEILSQLGITVGQLRLLAEKRVISQSD